MFHRLFLGLLLVIMYVNNIYNVTENLSFVLYAEDITSFTTHNTTNILFNRTNIKLSNNDNKLCNWLCLHRLSLNVRMSKYINKKIKENYC